MPFVKKKLQNDCCTKFFLAFVLVAVTNELFEVDKRDLV
jgi:hypothetical protein